MKESCNNLVKENENLDFLMKESQDFLKKSVGSKMKTNPVDITKIKSDHDFIFIDSNKQCPNFKKCRGLNNLKSRFSSHHRYILYFLKDF